MEVEAGSLEVEAGRGRGAEAAEVGGKGRTRSASDDSGGWTSMPAPATVWGEGGG